MAERVDPALVGGWVAGRSLARGVPLPVPDRGGWRVDTASDVERCRYIFAEPCAGLRHLATTIDEPGIALKLFDTAEVMRGLLPERWTIGPPGHLMTGDTAPPGIADLPRGYRCEADQRGAVRSVRILAPDGTLAASGHAALRGGFRVFDRIVTHEAHRRRGLGRAMMAMLAGDTPREQALPLLVATDAGAALYGALGWTIRSSYATATIEPR